jgi:hypothetical protein
MRRINTWLIFFCAALLGGCSYRLYPSDWPDRAPAGATDCLDITGRYRTLSDPLPTGSGPCKWTGGLHMSFGGEASCVSLAEMFVYPVASEPTASWVEIKQGHDNLTVSYHLPKKDLQIFLSQQLPRRDWPGRLTEEGDGILEKVLLRDKDYECSAAGIGRIIASDWQNANIGAAKNLRSRIFRRAVDGSLLLDASDTEYGFFWLPPFALATYGNRWARWQLQEPGNK